MDATATLFQNMENPEARFRDTEINAVLMMLQKKREEHGAYFNNDKFPRAAFCKTDFFYELLQCHGKFERYRTKLPFSDCVTNIVKGTVFPHKKWKTYIDVVYGVIKSMVPHWIGVEINFKSCQVECFSCNSQWEKKGVVLDIVRRIADMIPTLLGIAENKKPKRHLEPFKVVHHTEEEFSLSNRGFWVTECPYENKDDTQVEDSQPTEEIPQGATHELESHASEGDQKQALTQAENSQTTIPEGTPTQGIPTTQEIPEAEGDPGQVPTQEIFFTAESEKELADSNSEERDTQLVQSLTTTEPISDEDVTHKVQTPPAISTSMETVGGNEPAEMENDDGSQENNETTVQTPPVVTSTETVAGAGQTGMDKEDRTQPMEEQQTVQTPPVVTSTETVAGTEPTEVDNDDGSPEKDETTVQTPPVVASTETIAGKGQTEVDNDDGSQEKNETTNVKGTNSMAIVLWQPSPSGAGNQTDEVASEKRGLSFQKDTAYVVAMDTSANEESAAELQKHVKVVDVLRIRPTVANTKAKEKRVDDESDRPTKSIGEIQANGAWFRRLENPSTRVNGQEVDAAMMLFNDKREEHAAYFHNNRFPRAAFCNSMFFSELLDFHNIFKKPRCKKDFPENVIEVVKGNKYPNKNWKKDVDFIYGMAKPKTSLHWIGLAIDMKKRRVECFSCRHPKEPKASILQVANDIAEMIPVLLCVAEKVKPMQNLVPFEVVYDFEETVAKSSTISNSGIFVLKMIECHFVKIEDFSRICDEVVQDLRSNLVWEIFDHFKKK
ncbi:unnamed protein product [Thlaspi arvense]|uniref:Ubiquitin-like protease family profile domain-containing protein n=1 Tax=Thlaspi arvense TaxID=13288 RepID=A0AAU9R875_THLAR|nr:unnamed protein product [Thlaspi arvense]